jgi:predicted small secreted protein
MKEIIKRAVLLGFAACALVFGVTACHTAHGAGEDIQSTGESIQNNTPP